VRWEGPHRIAQALAGVPTQIVHVLENEPLPDPSALSGAVVMGGPMSVNDTARYPDLAREKTWIERALADGLPLLGVCLGSQLIAEVLGAHVRRAARPELGWSPVTVTASDDPVAGPLAPRTTVLHWHGEEFDVPPGAQRLAFSEQTGGQGFRHGSAWGLLFHMEADSNLVEHWLSVDEMATEARRVLGPQYGELLRDGARHVEKELVGRSRSGLDAFAGYVRGGATRTRLTERSRASGGPRTPRRSA
jgi:GMP synthase (glutamine-hydrolysing)